MNYSRLYWHTAAQVCTDNELQVLTLHHHRNLGTRRIGLALGITRSAARDRLHSAEAKIAAALKENAA